MSTSHPTNLSPFERWMVQSNLATIRETNVSAREQTALLRANGYFRVAQAVEAFDMGLLHGPVELCEHRPDLF